MIRYYLIYSGIIDDGTDSKLDYFENQDYPDQLDHICFSRVHLFSLIDSPEKQN